MKFNDIRQRLELHISSLPNAPPIIFENQLSAHKADIFLACTDLPSKSETDTYCLSEVKTGIYSINIYTKSSKGSGVANEWADKIHDHFRHENLDGLYCSDVSKSQGIVTDTHYIINLSINYRTLEA